jgi:hypothetical protein
MKKKCTILIKINIAIISTFSIHFFNGQIGINTSNPHPSSILDLTSTSKGLLIPRLSTLQRNSIMNPAEGLMIYDNTLKGFYGFDGTNWSQNVFGSTKWSLNGNSGTDPVNDFIGTTDDQPISFRTGGVAAMTVRADGRVNIEGRNIAGPRLLVSRPVAGASYPNVLAVVENNATSAYPVNYMAVNGGGGRVNGNYSFATSGTNALAGITAAGMSYVDSPGLVFYVGNPITQNNGGKDVLILGTNGNAYIGYYSGSAMPTAKLNIAGGDVYMSNIGSGAIMKSPNGACWRVKITNAGALTTESLTCPI